MKHGQVGAEVVPVTPVPGTAPRCPGLDAAGVTMVHAYRDAADALLCYVVRLEFPDPSNPEKRKKIFAPWTLMAHGDGACARWEKRALPAPRPLYNLHHLAARQDQPVILVEGEKCADALAAVCHDAVVMTWPGGANGVKSGDFTVLAGRTVILVPDNDEPGMKAMADIVAVLDEIGAAGSCLVDIDQIARAFSGESRPKFDIADALSEGFQWPGVDNFLKSYAQGVIRPDDAPDADIDPVHALLHETFGVTVMLPPKFDLCDEGLFLVETDRNGMETRSFLSSPLFPIAKTCAPGNQGWGRLVAYRTPDRSWTTVMIPLIALAGDGREMRETLAQQGVLLGQGSKARQALMECIGGTQPSDTVQIAARCGWADSSFVLPDRVMSPTGAASILPPDFGGVDHHFCSAGSFEAWRKMAAALGSTSRGVFAISVALAGPLAPLVGEAGGGFHLHGRSSRGKTSLLVAAASVWGGGGRDGAVRSWSMTANGGEAIAALHSGTLLALDEIHLAVQDEIAEIVYRLVNGQGKARAGKTGAATRSAQWHALILSSGEATIAARLGAGRRERPEITGGLAVRMVDVPHVVDEDRTFEKIPGNMTEAEFVKSIRAQSLEHYGHAGPAFVQKLVENRDAAREFARGLISSFVSDAVDADADPQIGRVAARFGLVAAAGRLAVQWGILPWHDAVPLRAARVCFDAWLASRGTTAAEEEVRALQRVAAFFEQHGSARFEPFYRGGHDQDDPAPRTQGVITRDRAGYREQTDDGTVFHVLPSVWRDEICAGHDPLYVARLLDRLGALEKGDGTRYQKKIRLPDYPGGTRVYTV